MYMFTLELKNKQITMKLRTICIDLFLSTSFTTDLSYDNRSHDLASLIIMVLKDLLPRYSLVLDLIVKEVQRKHRKSY